MRNWSKWVKIVLVVGISLACTNTTDTGGCGGPATGTNLALAPNPNTGPCTLQVTLNKADQGYTADLYLDGATPDLLISNTKMSVGKIARRYTTPDSNPRFFIKVFPSNYPWYGSTYNVYSDSAWARVNVVSATAQTVGFEDIPDAARSDLDYNDVMIASEKVNCGTNDPVVVVADPGTEPTEEDVQADPPPPPDPEVVTDPANPPPPAPMPAGVIVIPAGGAAKVHANFLKSTFDVGDLYLDGNPPELLIAKASNQKGASAKNFFEEEEWLIFFLAVNGTNYYATDPTAARVEKITDNNYRIYFEVDGDLDFNDAIVHIVITPPE